MKLPLQLEFPGVDELIFHLKIFYIFLQNKLHYWGGQLYLAFPHC